MERRAARPSWGCAGCFLFFVGEEGLWMNPLVTCGIRCVNI